MRISYEQRFAPIWSESYNNDDVVGEGKNATGAKLAFGGGARAYLYNQRAGAAASAGFARRATNSRYSAW